MNTAKRIYVDLAGKHYHYSNIKVVTAKSYTYTINIKNKITTITRIQGVKV